LHKLAKETHDLLTSLGLTHALCYGALWGQIRISRSLPWENDVEFCVINDELMQKDEASIFSAFRRKNLLLSYDSVDGLYTVTSLTVDSNSDRKYFTSISAWVLNIAILQLLEHS
jgi:hypothetical protein